MFLVVMIILLGSGSNVVSGDENVAASGDDNIATSDGGNDVCDNLLSDESDGIFLGDNLPDSEHPLRTALFDSEQEELLQRRFDEGYNLRTDPDYNHWLEINHPEVSSLNGHSLNQEASLSVSDIVSLQPVSTDTNETTKLTPEVEDLKSELKSPSQVVTPDTRDKKSISSSTPKSTCKSTPTLLVVPLPVVVPILLCQSSLIILLPQLHLLDRISLLNFLLACHI